MTEFLPIPDELQFLIEKREAADRRQHVAPAQEAQPSPPPGVERRSGQDRRQLPSESPPAL